MLNEIEIENIIKSKYQDCKVNNNVFAFDIQEEKEADDNFTTYKTLSYDYDNQKVLLYEKGTIQYEEEYNVVEKYYINNNIIELKHTLEIEITKQDVMDWLMHTFDVKGSEIDFGGYFYINKLNKYFIDASIDNKIILTINIMCKIFVASNSSEYYKLYNIINNIF